MRYVQQTAIEIEAPFAQGSPEPGEIEEPRGARPGARRNSPTPRPKRFAEGEFQHENKENVLQGGHNGTRSKSARQSDFAPLQAPLSQVQFCDPAPLKDGVPTDQGVAREEEAGEVDEDSSVASPEMESVVEEERVASQALLTKQRYLKKMMPVQ